MNSSINSFFMTIGTLMFAVGVGLLWATYPRIGAYVVIFGFVWAIIHFSDDYPSLPE
jgi:hypothetical protein